MIPSKREITKALDIAASLGLSDTCLDCGSFKVAPQHIKGTSIWAQLLKKKKILPSDVLWAFIDREPKKWLAIRVFIRAKEFSFSCAQDRNIFYFSLQSDIDKKILKQLEKEFQEFCTHQKKTEKPRPSRTQIVKQEIAEQDIDLSNYKKEKLEIREEKESPRQKRKKSKQIQELPETTRTKLESWTDNDFTFLLP